MDEPEKCRSKLLKFFLNFFLINPSSNLEFSEGFEKKKFRQPSFGRIKISLIASVMLAIFFNVYILFKHLYSYHAKVSFGNLSNSLWHTSLEILAVS